MKNPTELRPGDIFSITVDGNKPKLVVFYLQVIGIRNEGDNCMRVSAVTMGASEPYSVTWDILTNRLDDHDMNFKYLGDDPNMARLLYMEE